MDRPCTEAVVAVTQWGLDTLFNPAKRHLDEEKRRLQSTREEVGDNSGGKRVDFDSGKVRINKSDEENDAETTKRESTSRRKKPRRSDRDEDGKPSEAAIRAAKRRGRTIS